MWVWGKEGAGWKGMQSMKVELVSVDDNQNIFRMQFQM